MTFSPVGNYSARQLDHARAYRLLVHAEFEAFLEDRCRTVANSALTQFCADGKPKLVTLNLLSFHPAGEPGDSEMKQLVTSKTKHCFGAATSSNTQYNRVLATNHTVRESNVLRMLLPLGFDPADLDTTWVNSLDTFCTNRGEVAHTSIRTQQQIDPEGEMNTVLALLRGFERLDRLIDNL